VIALCERVRATGADLIVTIGGGTAIDTVKVALVCLAGGVATIEEMDQWHVRLDAEGKKIVPKVGMPPLRQIVVPTTLSAAEFSDLGGCTDTRSGVKQAYTGSHIGSASVILDPWLTLHTPARLWLSTGIRAVDHAVESLCSINAQPLVDATCVKALDLLATALRAYVANPQDIEGRAAAQSGAWLASTGINRTDYGASHGLGHVLGADSGVPHGITSCVLLPTVMRYNTEACAPQLRAIAQALGDADVPAADQVEALIRAIGLPTRIGELGIDRARIEVMAQKAMGSPWVRTNPRPISQPAQAAEILNSAW
jgi:alcohol dehydrogenase class IV